MRALWALLLVTVLIGTFFTQPIMCEEAETAEEDVEDSTEETQKPAGPDTGVTTAFLFPRQPNGEKLPIGEYVETLIGINNGHDATTYRAEYAVAYLLSRDTATQFFVQNFSGAFINRTIAPGESATVSYRFKPDPVLDPRSYGLVVQVFYMNDDNETFLATPFNATVTLTDEGMALDARTLFGYASALGLVGLVGFVLYGRNGSKTTSVAKKPSASRNEDGIDYSYVSSHDRSYVRARSHTPGKKSN